ncbi:DUF3857 domain-containing protein [uncultured Tenacibaculum sp.]|uniref:DUF3857 domain-containing protein n=1 Tax=uncultured Tenacibaculum sp. TaxID=174713 RepID=UPI0026317F86|nr:DUF3857 domain-containing protein [uncultured Tenacibaculum sp.]
MIKYGQKKSFRFFFQLTIILLSPLLIFSQENKEQDFYKRKYPEALKVRLNQEISVSITLNKGKLEINQEFLEEDLYLNSSANYASKSSVKYSSFFELEEIEASSFSFEKGKYVEYEVEKFTEKDNLNDVFYDDVKELSFIYPNLRKGSKTKLYYKEKIKNPRFLGHFYFADYFPIIKNKITLIVDKGIELNFKKFNLNKINLKYSKRNKGRKVIYSWVVDNAIAFKFEDDSPNYKNVLPHIIPYITTYKVKGKTKKVLGSVRDLYDWYYSLVKDVNKEKTNPELVQLVKKLTDNKKNDLEKVRAIFYWVQKNIKYIAFEYELGGFIPRESNDVFHKKYGDCKDNSSILFKMLEIADLKGNLTWIGTRSIPYSYNEVPTPAVDNHMILSYDFDGKTYYLDATGRYIELGMPTSFIQGKEALIADGSNFKVKKVPIIKAEKNKIKDSTIIRISKNSLLGKTESIISGYPKTDFFSHLESKSSEAKLKEYYNIRFRKGHNKFLIKNIVENNKYNYDKDFKIKYDFVIDNYIKEIGNEIYVNLNLNKEIQKFKIEKEREFDIEYNYKSSFEYVTVLTIPENYEVDYIPENIMINDELLKVSINYKVNGNKIIYKHDLQLNYLVLNKQEQDYVNKLIEKILKNYKEIIVLKKTN